MTEAYTTNTEAAEKFTSWFSSCIAGVRAKSTVNSLIAGLRRKGIDFVGISKETRQSWLDLLCPRKYIRAGNPRQTVIIDSLIDAGLIKAGRLRKSKGPFTPEEKRLIKECITELIRVNLQDIDSKTIYGSLLYGPVDSGKTHFVTQFLTTQKVRPVYINANDIDSVDYLERHVSRGTETGEHVLSMMGAQGYSGNRVLVIDDFDAIHSFRQYTQIIKQLILLFKPTKGKKSLHHIESIFANQKIVAPVIIIVNNPFSKKIYNMYRVFKAFPSALIKWERPSDSDIRAGVLSGYPSVRDPATVDRIVTAARGHYTQMALIADMYVACPTESVFSQDVRSHADSVLVNLYTGGDVADSDTSSDKLDHLIWATYQYAVHTINPTSGRTDDLANLQVLCSVSESMSVMDVFETSVAEEIYVMGVPSRIPQIVKLHFNDVKTTEARRQVLHSRLVAEETRIKCLLERTKQRVSKRTPANVKEDSN